MELPADFVISPPHGCLWCTVCLMITRGVANDMLKARLGEMDDQEAVIEAIGSGQFPLRPAVTWGVPVIVGPQPFGSGMVNQLAPLCWEHALGVSVKQGGVVPANPQEQAMFGRKVPQIGGKRG